MGKPYVSCSRNASDPLSCAAPDRFVCASASSRRPRTGAANQGRYSNPALDALTARAASTLDNGARERLLQEAVKMAMDDVAIMPLFQIVNIWAVRRGFEHTARRDELTRAQDLRPAAR